MGLKIGDLIEPTADPIEEIIEYIMKTPENINANILREMLINIASGEPTEPIEVPMDPIT